MSSISAIRSTGFSRVAGMSIDCSVETMLSRTPVSSSGVAFPLRIETDRKMRWLRTWNGPSFDIDTHAP